DLIVEEKNCDGDQHQRGAYHPDQENFGIRGIGGAAPGEYAHYHIVELDPDLDQRRAADGVDPERLADTAADPLRQSVVKERKERLGAGRRQSARREEIDREA